MTVLLAERRNQKKANKQTNKVMQLNLVFLAFLAVLVFFFQ